MQGCRLQPCLGVSKRRQQTPLTSAGGRRAQSLTKTHSNTLPNRRMRVSITADINGLIKAINKILAAEVNWPRVQNLPEVYCWEKGLVRRESRRRVERPFRDGRPCREDKRRALMNRGGGGGRGRGGWRGVGRGEVGGAPGGGGGGRGVVQQGMRGNDNGCVSHTIQAFQNVPCEASTAFAMPIKRVMVVIPPWCASFREEENPVEVLSGPGRILSSSFSSIEYHSLISALILLGVCVRFVRHCVGSALPCQGPTEAG